MSRELDSYITELVKALHTSDDAVSERLTQKRKWQPAWARVVSVSSGKLRFTLQTFGSTDEELINADGYVSPIDPNAAVAEREIVGGPTPNPGDIVLVFLFGTYVLIWGTEGQLVTRDPDPALPEDVLLNYSIRTRRERRTEIRDGQQVIITTLIPENVDITWETVGFDSEDIDNWFVFIDPFGFTSPSLISTAREYTKSVSEEEYGIWTVTLLAVKDGEAFLTKEITFNVDEQVIIGDPPPISISANVTRRLTGTDEPQDDVLITMSHNVNNNTEEGIGVVYTLTRENQTTNDNTVLFTQRSSSQNTYLSLIHI